MKSFSKCAAVLTGGLVFAGAASGAAFFEDFESATGTGGGTAGQLGGGTGGDWGAYGTAQDYSGTGGDHNTVVAGGGSFYGHTIGVAANPQSDAVAIDGGHGFITLSAWVANYTADGDFTQIGILQFSDAAGTVAADGGVAGAVIGDAADPDAWNFQSSSVAVAAGAVSYRVIYGGSGNDTYADNISAASSDVPEPGSLALLSLGGLALLRRRR